MNILPANIQKELDNADFDNDWLEFIDYPLIKKLIALVSGHPIIAYPAIEVLTKTVSIIKKEKDILFFSELKRNSSLLNEGLLSSNEFLQKFLITYKAVQETGVNEKIKYFTSLLMSSSSNENYLPIDQCEELIRIIVELSFVEIKILSILDLFESSVDGYKEKKPNEKHEHVKLFWNKFHHRLKEYIPEEDINSRLNRLQRTGLYEKFELYTFDDLGNTDNPDGFLTSLYYKLKEYAIRNEIA